VEPITTPKKRSTPAGRSIFTIPVILLHRGRRRGAVVRDKGDAVRPRGQAPELSLQPHEEVIDLADLRLGLGLRDLIQGEAVELAVVEELDVVAAVTQLPRRRVGVRRSVSPVSVK